MDIRAHRFTAICLAAVAGTAFADSLPGEDAFREIKPSVLKTLYKGPSGECDPAICFTPDGKYLVAVEEFGSIAHFWDLNTMKETRKIPLPKGMLFVSPVVAPDGKSLMLGAETLGADMDQAVLRLDTASGKILAKFPLKKGEVLQGLSPSADGKLLAVSTRMESEMGDVTGTIVSLWALSPVAKELWRSQAGKEGLFGAAVCFPDGKTLAWIENRRAQGGLVHLLDVTSLKESEPIEVHRPAANDCRVFSDGKRMVTSGFDDAVRIWDLEKREEMMKVEHASGGRGVGVFCSKDGGCLLSIDFKELRFWDASTGQELARAVLEPAGASRLGGAALSPDGKIFALNRREGGGTFLYRLEDPGPKK